MTLKEKAKLLKGRRIVSVAWNAFKTGRSSGRGNGWTADPLLVLDDGTRVRFSVDEIEIGEYGISVDVYPKNLGGSDAREDR